MFRSISPESPLNRPGPSSDVDPPPSLPFDPQPVVPEGPIREASQPATAPVVAPIAKSLPPLSNDPPPAPPVSFVSYEY
jgi:hypothetical protein